MSKIIAFLQGLIKDSRAYVLLFAGVLGFAVVIGPLLDLRTTVIEVKGDQNVIYARTIGDVQPSDVACKGSVTVANAARGPFYQAILGDVNLSWTDGDERFAMSDSSRPPSQAWPETDRATIECLTRRARAI